MEARRAGIYTRISLDRDGRSESPDRQQADCRRLCQERGWQVVDVYGDRDLSAYKRGVKRPQFERLLRDLQSGRIDALVVWKLDRLTRQGVTGITRVIQIVLEARAELVSANDPSMDTTTPMGRGALGLFASVAEQESENTSTRVRASHRASAAKGRPHGGGSRLFGYDRAGGVIEGEAAVVREVSARIIEGESLRQIAFDLNRRDIRPSGKRRLTPTERELDPAAVALLDRGTEWRSVTLGQMIRSPRLAGLRVYEPQVGQREVHPGTWQPILTVEHHQAVLAALAQPLTTRRAKTRHLLTGLVVCGECGGNLKTMGFVMRNGKSFPRYQCVQQPGHVNCGRIAVTEKGLDAYVTDQVLGFLSRAQLRPVEVDLETEADLLALADADRLALQELTHARFVQRTVRPDDYEVARAELEKRLAATEDSLVTLNKSRERLAADLQLGDRASLDRWWADAPVEERREVLARTISRVEVKKAERRGGNRFDPTRVRLDYRWDIFIEAAEHFEATATDSERADAERDYRTVSTG